MERVIGKVIWPLSLLFALAMVVSWHKNDVDNRRSLQTQIVRVCASAPEPSVCGQNLALALKAAAAP